MGEQQTDLAFLTVSQAAKAAKLSRSAIYEACDQKRLAHYRLSGGGRRGKIMIRPTDLETFIEGCRVEASPLPCEEDLPHLR
jgi:excisionase family DNA binding protein